MSPFSSALTSLCGRVLWLHDFDVCQQEATYTWRVDRDPVQKADPITPLDQSILSLFTQAASPLVADIRGSLQLQQSLLFLSLFSMCLSDKTRLCNEDLGQMSWRKDYLGLPLSPCSVQQLSHYSLECFSPRVAPGEQKPQSCRADKSVLCGPVCMFSFLYFLKLGVN